MNHLIKSIACCYLFLIIVSCHQISSPGIEIAPTTSSTNPTTYVVLQIYTKSTNCASVAPGSYVWSAIGVGVCARVEQRGPAKYIQFQGTSNSLTFQEFSDPLCSIAASATLTPISVVANGVCTPSSFYVPNGSVQLSYFGSLPSTPSAGGFQTSIYQIAPAPTALPTAAPSKPTPNPTALPTNVNPTNRPTALPINVNPTNHPASPSISCSVLQENPATINWIPTGCYSPSHGKSSGLSCSGDTATFSNYSASFCAGAPNNIGLSIFTSGCVYINGQYISESCTYAPSSSSSSGLSSGGAFGIACAAILIVVMVATVSYNWTALTALCSGKSATAAPQPGVETSANAMHNNI